MMKKKAMVIATVIAIIMLPAAIGTFCLWCGMDERTLMWLPGYALLMAPVMFLRIFFIPQLLCLISVCCVILQAIKVFQDSRLSWHLPVTLLLTAASCAGLVYLEIFFPAAMGI